MTPQERLRAIGMIQPELRIARLLSPSTVTIESLTVFGVGMFRQE